VSDIGTINAYFSVASQLPGEKHSAHFFTCTKSNGAKGQAFVGWKKAEHYRQSNVSIRVFVVFFLLETARRPPERNRGLAGKWVTYAEQRGITES